jgi:hypothetical protein
MVPSAVLALLSACASEDDRPSFQLQSRAQALTVQRSTEPALQQAIMGALLFLDDTQIRDRPGWHHPTVDACASGGCLPVVPGLGRALPVPLPFLRNVSGEWANHIHILPEALGWLDQGTGSLLQIQDSNSFMVAAVQYPLYLFDESALPADRRTVSAMRARAAASVASYQRGPAFNFWPQQSGVTSAAPRVGPLNIPPLTSYFHGVVLLLPRLGTYLDGPAQRQWMADALDARINPHGADAFANIVDDADDTAVAWASLHLAARFDGRTAPAAAPLDEMSRWRDLGRTLQDGRDDWKPADSGAFLTWLGDENLPRRERFRHPDTGVIPYGVNNVDCVVNANAVLAMGLAGRGDDPVTRAATATLAVAARRRAWPACGLYYPQRQIFPYALSRAYRDGNVRDPDMTAAVAEILSTLLEDQAAHARAYPEHRGAFPGGPDPSLDLSTALALSALLNIGVDTAEQLGLRSRYEEAVAGAVAYLVARQQGAPILFSDTFDRSGGANRSLTERLSGASRWQPGVYFAASTWSLAQWRSEAYTAAMVLEALAKYLLAYEEGDVTITAGRRIRPLSYAASRQRAAADLHLTVAPE